MPRAGLMKDGLHLIEDILKDASQDVGTQTLDNESERNKTEDEGDATSDLKANLFTKGSVPNINLTRTRSSRSPDFKSSFRLFIVPERKSKKECSRLKLSLEDTQINSFRYSVTSPHDDCYETATSNSKYRKTPRKVDDPRTQNTFHRADKTKGKWLGSSSSVNRDNFMTEHQLIHSTNPGVVAWLKLKNFEEKQKRNQKRREKREKRRAERVEAEEKKEREEESKKKFAQWLAVKKKEVKRAWRETHAKGKVNRVETKQQIQNEDTPPPNYTVVPSFKGAQAWDESLETLSLQETGEKLTPKKLNVIQDSTPKQQDNIKRPQTTGSVRRGASTTKKHARHKVWSKTASGRLAVDSGKKISEGSKITYEDWLERKRRENREKAKERKREIVDEALTDRILKLARKRVENILQGKKDIDTGIPKWRAKNRVRKPHREIGPNTQVASSGEYVLPAYLQGKEGLKETSLAKSRSEEENLNKKCLKCLNCEASRGFKATQRPCDNVKLDSNELALAGERLEGRNSARKLKNNPDVMSDNVKSMKVSVCERQTSTDEKFLISLPCSDTKVSDDTEDSVN